MTRPQIPQDHADPFLTTREAAVLLGVSLRSVQLWVDAGTLPAGTTPGGHRLIRTSAVQALARRNGISTDPTPQRQQLTDEQIVNIYCEQTGSAIDDSPFALMDFARAIEHACAEQWDVKLEGGES